LKLSRRVTEQAHRAPAVPSPEVGTRIQDITVIADTVRLRVRLWGRIRAAPKMTLGWRAVPNNRIFRFCPSITTFFLCVNQNVRTAASVWQTAGTAPREAAS
jgi:hypothetical protein